MSGSLPSGWCPFGLYSCIFTNVGVASVCMRPIFQSFVPKSLFLLLQCVRFAFGRYSYILFINPILCHLCVNILMSPYCGLVFLRPICYAYVSYNSFHYFRSSIPNKHFLWSFATFSIDQVSKDASATGAVLMGASNDIGPKDRVNGEIRASMPFFLGRLCQLWTFTEALLEIQALYFSTFYQTWSVTPCND